MSVARTLALVLALAALARPAAAQRVAQGQEFPDFSAKNVLTGETFKLSDYRGKVVLVDFWATWCRPCVMELPNVQRTYRKYAHRGFEVISISLDNDRAKFDRFVEQKGMTWPQVMEGGGWKTPLAMRYGIRSIPSMFLIDARGKCVATNLRGAQLEHAVERAIEAVPEEKPAPAADPLPALSESDAASLSEAAGAVRTRLESASATYAAQRAALDAAEQGITELERQLPRPADLAAFQRAYGAAREALVNARAELFASGLLDDDHPVVLPPDPYAGKTDEKGPVLAVRRQLPALRQALARMNLALSRPARLHDEAAAGLEAVDERLGDGHGRSAELHALLGEVSKNAGRLADLYDTAWQDQVRRLDDSVARLVDATDPAWTGLKERIRDLHKELEAAADDPAALATVRAHLVDIGTEVLARLDARTPTSSVTGGRRR